MTIGIKRYPQAEMVKVIYLGAFLSALTVLPFADFTYTSQQDIAWLWLYGVMNIGVGFGLGGAVILLAVLGKLAWSSQRRSLYKT
jgi:hypothetical protein